MASELVQTILNAEVDAISLSEFIWKPIDFMVERRLAPPINTLNFYIDKLENYTAGLDDKTAQVNAELTTKANQAKASIDVAVSDANGVIDNKVSQSEAQIDVIVNDARLDSISKTSSIVQIVKDDINNVLSQTIDNASFNIIDSFELGATLTKRTDALRHTLDGKLYRWGGVLPKVVPTSSTPSSSGGFGASAWLEVSDIALRQELSSETGYRKVANQMAANAYGAPAKLYDVVFKKNLEHRVLDFFDGYYWALSANRSITKSKDGETWENTGAIAPVAGANGLLPTSDGEVLILSPSSVYKSVNWGGSTTWKKVVTNPSTEAEAPFLRWGFDGKGDKFILTHYGAGGSNFAKSRYVWLSTDAGNTWEVVWDTDAQTGGDSAQSHLHAVCYDSWADRFYFSEGHGAIAGIYYSDDNGQNWSKMQNDRNLSPAFTVMVATDFGIVCGTDSDEHGIYVIRRAINPDEQGIELLARYPNPKGRDGVIGFADRGHRDPDTGIVYVGFMSNFDIITPVVFAVGSGGATVAVEMPESTTGFVSVRYYNVVAGNGKLLGRVLGHPTHAGSFTAKTSKYTTTPSALSSDYGNILPNDTINTLPSSLRIGINSTVNGQRSIAVGNMAVAGANAGSQDVIAIGHGASGGSNGNTAIGMNAKCPAQYSIALGLETKTEGIESVAIGSRAAIPVGSTLSVAVGYETVVAGAQSTSVGAKANAKAFSASFGFESLADSTNCLAAGWKSKALGVNSVALGSSSSASGTRASALGYTSTASGEAATSFGANSKANAFSVSVGESSSALSTSAVAVGKNTKADNPSTVAVGYAAVANGSYGVSVGRDSTSAQSAISVGYAAIAAYNAVALGSNAEATQSSVSIGRYSKVTNAAGGCIAIGLSTNVSGAKAIAIGDNSSATHSNSVAIGSATESTKSNCLTVGTRDIESTKAGGKIYLKSPDGTSYAISVGDDGLLTATPV